MESNLERINPDLINHDGLLGAQTLALHLERYRFAARHVRGPVVADIACGVGYGSALLLEECPDRIRHIYAVDSDDDSIRYAKTRYVNPAISFIRDNAVQYTCPDQIDTLVSLETIEHLPDPQAFVQHISAQLSPGGRVIASVPITPSMDANPFHLHDFTSTRFRRLFGAAGMHPVAELVQKQAYSLIGVMRTKEERSQDLRKNIAAYYLRHPGKLILRLRSLLTDGTVNKYYVGVFEKNRE